MNPLFVVRTVLILLLAGCTHVPVSSMIRLARIDPATTDPAQLRAAVKLPLVLEPREMSLRLSVRISGGSDEAQDFRLREVSAPNDVLALHAELEANTRIFAYMIDPTELGRLTAFRESLKQNQRARGGKGGSVTISIHPQACRTDELANGPIYFTTYLRTAETGGYVPLARNLDLRTMAPGRDIAKEIPRCADAGPPDPRR